MDLFGRIDCFLLNKTTKATETQWQAGRLPQFQRCKLLSFNYLCRWRQPANPPWKLARWQAEEKKVAGTVDRSAPRSLARRHQTQADWQRLAEKLALLVA